MPEKKLERLRAEFGELLRRDPDKEFGPEFVRTTDLERKLVDEHGFDAIRLIFSDRNSENYYSLGDFPDECPWSYLNALELESAIQAVFQSIAAEMPNLLPTLGERCQFLYAERTDETWLLHYFLNMQLYDGRLYYEIYTGGPPNADPVPNDSLTKFDWSIPPDLARLYAVHDGFGPILGSRHISVMAEMMDPICQEQNTYPDDYQYRDLLEFHPDGAGNAQCFYRGAGEMVTVDWDHEVWEISGSQGFFGYVDERLSQLDEE